MWLKVSDKNGKINHGTIENEYGAIAYHVTVSNRGLNYAVTYILVHMLNYLHA
jgi:hypothetical protein